MNDRYFFRGKRADNGEWVVGSLNIIPDGRIEIGAKCIEPPDCDPMWQKVLITYEVIPETVGQCTGLKDKNGKLVFEWDICEYGASIGVISFDNSDAMFTFIYDENIQTDFSCMWGKDLEIIGNIHDNPELLEVEE